MRSPLTLLLLIGCAILPKAAVGRLLPLFVWRQPPTSTPTSSPSYNPSAWPSIAPTSSPSSQPTSSPLVSPSSQPSFSPSSQPSFRPSLQPTLSASSLLQLQQSEAEAKAKTSKTAFWLKVSLVSLLLYFAFMVFICLRRSRKRGSQCLPRVAAVAASSGGQNTEDKRRHEEQEKTKDKQLSSVYPSRRKPDENQDKQKQAEKKQARQKTSPPEEEDGGGWASSMGSMLSSFVPSLPESSPNASESPLSLFSCSAAQFTPTTENKKESKRRREKNKEKSKRRREKNKEETKRREETNKKESKRRGERDKGSVKEHSHRDKRSDDRNTSAASLPFSAEMKNVAAAEDARPSLKPKRKPTDKYEIESTISNDGSSSDRRWSSRDDIQPKKITYSDGNAANAIGGKSANPSGIFESRVEQVNVQTFQQNNPNYAGYASSKYALSPPHQHNRSQPGYSYNGYGVSPQYPYQVGSGYGMSNYGVPPPQHPYQGNPGYSLSRYSLPGEHPESGPPESHKQGGRVDPPVPPNQTPPSSEGVEELKQGRVDPPACKSQTTPNKRREGEDPNGVGSVEKQRHRNDSKKDLQNLPKRKSDRTRDDKMGKGDRSIAHKHKKDDNDNSNPGTATSTWGFGWLSNSLPQGGNSECIESIADESASAESAGSSISQEDSSSEEDSRYSFVVPSDSSDESDSSDDDSAFSLSGIDDSMFSV